MPRAHDLRRPRLDKNPLDIRLDFQDPQSIMGEGARIAGDGIQKFTFGQREGARDDALEQLAVALVGAVGDTIEGTIALITAFAEAIGLSFAALVNALTGGDAVKVTPDELQAAMAHLNGRVTALEGGGVVTTYTVSGIWTNPTPTEHKPLTVICVNGGDGGARGSASIFDSAKGGLDGGYIQRQFFTDEIPETVAMTIGVPGVGNSSTGGGPGGLGTITSFGSLLVGIKGAGAVFDTSGSMIPYKTGVSPGKGGDGGFYVRSTFSGGGESVLLIPSTDGEGGPFAPGGRAGFGDTSAETAGKAGVAAPVNIPSGGGGGGGGSITTAAFQNSGAGGNGGFPGGGGGGGARENATYRPGGHAGAGCIYIITES